MAGFGGHNKSIYAARIQTFKMLYSPFLLFCKTELASFSVTPQWATTKSSYGVITCYKKKNRLLEHIKVTKHFSSKLRTIIKNSGAFSLKPTLQFWCKNVNSTVKLRARSFFRKIEVIKVKNFK